MTQALSVCHTGPGKVELAATQVPALADGHVLIRTRYSAISAGTESLIFRGEFPAGLSQDDTIRSLQKPFEYPFAYGYALVGEIVDAGAGVDRAWLGRHVFAFHPHQDLVVVPLGDVMPLPSHVEPRAALFLPNMEAAVNFALDASPLIGEITMVFGLGIVGLLTTALLAQLALAEVLAADPISGRRARALAFGATRAVDPHDAEEWSALRQALFEREPPGLDLAFELSGNTDALDQAIALSGFTGRIIVGSWYPRSTRAPDLGTHFHRQRIELISSQVSSIGPRLSGRWNKTRRFGVVWDQIARLEPQRLITHTFPLHESQRAFELASRKDEDALQIVFEYR